MDATTGFGWLTSARAVSTRQATQQQRAGHGDLTAAIDVLGVVEAEEAALPSSASAGTGCPRWRPRPTIAIVPFIDFGIRRAQHRRGF